MMLYASWVAYGTALFFVIVMSVFVTLAITNFMLKYLWTPPETYVDTVTWDGKDAELAASVRERLGFWAARRASADQSPEVLFAQDHLGRAYERLEKLELSVAGVPVTGALGVVQKIVDPPYRLIALQGETQGDTHNLVARLKVRGNIQGEWRLSRSFDKADSDPAKNALIDAMVFRILFELGNRKAQAAKSGSAKLGFPNARALEAYLRGSERLEVYLTGLRPDDLKSAIQNLATVNWEMPDSEPVLDLYALALTEDRKETKAIPIYGKLLGGDGPLTAAMLGKLDRAGRERKYQLELNRSQAQSFLYEPGASKVSVEHLVALRALIQADLRQTGTSADDLARLHSISAFTDAQLADVVGHLIAIIRHNTTPDATLVDALNLARGVTGEAPLAAAATLADFAKAVLATNIKLNELAEAARGAAGKYWASNSASALTDQRSLARLMHSSRGYTRYHHARLTAPNKSDFKAECHEAIADLEAARLAQPQNYTVLQNLGRVHSDEALREDDPQFSVAIDYFQRSIELKPSDYWGYSNLARIFGRRLETELPASFLGDARKHADSALAARPNDPELYLISARVAMWEWTTAATAERETRQAGVEDLLERGKNGDQWDLQWAKAAWAIHSVRGFQSAKDKKEEAKQEFEIVRTASAATLEAAQRYYATHTTWEATQRKDRLESARKAIAEVQYEGRAFITRVF